MDLNIYKKNAWRFVLPNLATFSSLFFGISSIAKSFDGAYSTAAWFVFFSVLFDGIDGKIARLTKGTSLFGKELDSLADLVAFGVAPAFLAYKALLPETPLTFFLVFLFVACGASRLAFFNISVTNLQTKGDFSGLPIPAAGGMIAAYVLFSMDLWNEIRILPICGPGIFLLAILMISRITYPSFPKIAFRSFRKTITSIVLFVLIILFILNPQITGFIYLSLYILMGFPYALWERHKAALEHSLEEEEFED